MRRGRRRGRKCEEGEGGGTRLGTVHVTACYYLL